MTPYWVMFSDGSAGCCEGRSWEEATEIAEHITGKKWKEVYVLPYPANPIIWQFDHPIKGKCPAFCYSPNRCKGHVACPRHPSCTS